MLVYLDASVVVSLFVREPVSASVRSAIAEHAADLLLSDFCAGEISATFAAKARAGQLRPSRLARTFHDFDRWRDEVPEAALTARVDIEEAERMVRRPHLKLRFPDALHLAITQRLGARLATRDRLMADAAEALGLPVLRLD